MLLELSAFLKEYLKVRHFNRFRNRKTLEAYQEKKVRKLFKYVIPKSKFYRNYYKNFNVSDWRNLPTVDKSMMMENFSDLNTVGIDRDEAFKIAFKSEESRDFSPKINGITVGLSSGTSGNRGIFLVGDKEKMAWAGNIIGRVLPSSLFFGKPQKIAFFLRANSNLYTTLGGKKITFKFFDLLNEVENNIQELNLFQPTLLVAPPSMLKLLAKAIENQQLDISPIKIVSVAEVLDPMDKDYIESIFKQIIHQVYQCTEGFLGCTCEHGTLHLNEDMLVIQKEYLDKESGKFVPIITDFSRKSQPIIRYRLNDVLTEKKTPCSCGSPLTALEFIEGRCDDLFYFKDLKTSELKGVFPDFIRRAVIMASDKIEEYRVVQETINQVVVYLTLKDTSQKVNLEQVILKNLEELLAKQNCQIPIVTFDYHYKPMPKGTKLRRIERKFKLDEVTQ